LGALKSHAVLIHAIIAVASAGVLTTSLPAAAQDEPAAPPEGSPEAPPPAPEAGPAAAPEAPPAAVEGTAEATSAGTADVALEGSPEAEPIPEDPEVYEADLAEVVVTGFRVSLGAALQRKQRATGQVDAIVAEDMAEFPDLNLAESLQRVPGVAITRTNGEGNQITVRGLPGLYTRVRINGMEARSSVGNNGGRNFDFNLFASELFNSVVIHKTATADMEEGSLGAVVDLNTARAFNYDEGWTFVAGAQGAYNDLSNTVRPRLTGLVAYRDPAGIWGATASAAYTRVRLDTAYSDTVGWQKARFNSVDGVPCFQDVDGMRVALPGPGCDEVADAFHPRIPRYGQDSLRGDRLGLTAGVQFRPTDRTEIRLDGLYATYDSRNDQRRLFQLFRGNEGTFDISDYVLQSNPDRFGVGNDTLVAATVNNGWARNEHVRLDAIARFHQLSLAFDHRFSDSFYVNALAGTSRSRSGLPHDTTVQYDIRPYDGYRYDFSNENEPLLAFGGADVTDPGAALVTELRDRVGDIRGGFDMAEANLNFDIVDQLKLAAGVNYKVATLDAKQSTRDGLVCGPNKLVGLNFDCDTDDDGTDDLQGPPGDPAFSKLIEFAGDAGAGSTVRWASPGIDNWVERLGYNNVALIPNQNATNKVTEKSLGYYLQARGEVMLGSSDMRLMYDGGVRYVETRQSSTGYVTGALFTVDRPTYRDWLPSVNTALWLTEELVVRLAAARVMARPALADLSPGAAVDGFGYGINFQNPRLDPTRATALDAAAEWYFADGSLLSLAVFYKDIDSFPIRQSRRGTFASTGLPRSAIVPTTPADVSPEGEGTCGDPQGCWTISELTNGPGSKLQGLELGFQAPFSSFYGGLPPVIRSMGVLANYTYVDSEANYDFQMNTIKERLIGLSNGQYNATLYYDDGTLDVRASLAYRSDFLTVGPNSTGNLWDYVEGSTRLDASSGYDVTDNFKVTLEALNLTNAPFALRTDVDAQRRFQYNRAGRTFILGARVSY
jgi:iron complex outermembrane receptor protein